MFRMWRMKERDENERLASFIFTLGIEIVSVLMDSCGWIQHWKVPYSFLIVSCGKEWYIFRVVTAASIKFSYFIETTA